MGEVDLESLLAGRKAADIAELREFYDAPEGYPRARLADWLGSGPACSAVLVALDAFSLQLLETLMVSGAGRRRHHLDAAIDGRASRQQVDAALAGLTRRALAWPAGGGQWALNPGLSGALAMPCGLGPAAEELLPGATVVQLANAARLFRVEPAPRKAGLLAQVAALVADGAAVRSAVTRLSPAARGLLARLASPGGALHIGWNAVVPAGGRELIDRALLVVVDYDTGLVPAEVALALRDGRILIDVTPEPPDVGEPVAGEVTGRYAEAVASAVSDLARLLSSVSIRPLSQLAGGGVGAKEIRRLAKELHLPEARVSLLLSIAEDVEALERDAATVRERPGAAFAALTPAQQWLAMSTSFLTAREGYTTRVAFGVGRRGLSREVPPALLLTLVPPDRRLSAADLTVLLSWRLPRAGLLEPGPDAIATLADAEVLGLAVDGVPTELFTLTTTDPEAAVGAVEQLLPAQAQEVILQADLTATTTGPPAPALARLLDGAAESQTRGHASVWRFTPASVRRHLGAGASGDDLLAALAKVAPRGVPSVLTQLIADAGRRHGEVVVRSAAAVLLARDEAIAATLLGDRRLARLRLTRVAPTVLIASAGETAVLDAVRKAGYAPAAVAGGPQIVGPELEKLVKSAVRHAGRGAASVLLAAVRDGRPVTVTAYAAGGFTHARLAWPRLDPSHVSGTSDGATHRFKLSNVVTVSS